MNRAFSPDELPAEPFLTVDEPLPFFCLPIVK